MITLNNITKRYQHQGKSITALDKISLQVEAGEIFGIIGRSGAGKSTLIRCANLLEKPEHGEVIFDQQNLLTLSQQKLRSARRQISMIFQHFNLLSNSNVFNNVALPLKLIGKPKTEIKKIVTPLLELVGIQDKKNHYPAQLSGGQKQRVAIARALVTQPKVLLCDEATSALDPETTLSILDLLKKINQKYQLSILLITHEMEVIKEIAHRVAIIDQGKIIEENDTVSLFTKPQTELAKTFVKSTLPQQLPHEFQEKLSVKPFDHCSTVLRLTFHKDAGSDTAITEIIKKFDLSISILQANIEAIQKETIGVLFIEVRGEKTAMQQAVDYLHTKEIDSEVIGYAE